MFSVAAFSCCFLPLHSFAFTLTKSSFHRHQAERSCSSSTVLVASTKCKNKRKMKRAPIFPKDEVVDCNELGYDPQMDFSKVLEEARKHANDVKFSLSPSNSTEKKVEIEVTKNKRSWRRSLSLWFKQDKKSSKQNNTTETNSSKSSRVPTRKDGPVSGLLFGDGGKLAVIQRSIRRSASGPLATCFTPTRAEENEVPYMCLDQQSRPSGVQAFGPIYLVT